MFPSDVVAIQTGNASAGLPPFFVEDRDSFMGYQSPPCYSSQLSQLLNASSSGGALYATWTRPLHLPPALLAENFQDIELGPGGMTLISASSSDTALALEQCAPAMQLHSYCVPGVNVVFS